MPALCACACRTLKEIGIALRKRSTEESKPRTLRSPEYSRDIRYSEWSLCLDDNDIQVFTRVMSCQGVIRFRQYKPLEAFWTANRLGKPKV